jgi:hypothetical protein
LAEEKLEATREKCRVCGGKIVKRFIYQSLASIPRYGNPRDWGWVMQSKFCENCRIKYD